MPDEALQRLLEGNRRYVAGKHMLDESEVRRVHVAKAQTPFASILGCVDSRVSPELVLDQGLGDLFVIRTAGHVLDRAVLGSLEFGVAQLHIPILVVLGHQRCGALKAAINVLERNIAEEAEIKFLVEELEPAVTRGRRKSGDMWDNSVRAQIEITVGRLRRSPILSTAIERGALRVVGAYYNLDTGIVDITVE